jgi:hypothetical protein
VTSIFAMDGLEKPHVDYTPQKEGLPPYGGARQRETIGKVRVSSCISLGGGVMDKINQVLKGADQFIVCFMYRFDSPILMRTLEDKYIKSVQESTPMPVLVFLDHNQTYENQIEGSQYYNYVRRLIDSVPTSLVKLGSRAFHQKVIISKKAGEEAITILGSANATFEADNMHSEDIVLIQSNKLAAFYFDEFGRLLRSEPQKKSTAEAFPEQQVRVFHEHRVEEGKSNIDLLTALRKGLLRSEKVSMEGYLGDIVSLAISTGNPELEGTQKCLEVVNEALGAQDNAALLLFENYISLNEELKRGAIWRNLTSLNPKFIVLDNNKNNRGDDKEKSDGAQALRVNDNTVILFNPFTGKKFHHKLIVRYPHKGPPTVYTGSFHISTNAIKRNSETIIGVRSEELADEYVASLLLNSGLGERPEIWTFINDYLSILRRNVPLFSEPQETKVLQAARMLYVKTQINMGRFADRLDRVRSYVVGTASNGDEQLKISGCFEHYMVCFKEEEYAEGKLKAINDLKEKIFKEEEIYNIWLSYLTNLRRNIKGVYKEVEKLPTYSSGHPEIWLEEMGTWFEMETKEYKEKKLKIKEDMGLIERLYRALNDLYGYKATFMQYVDLSDVLGKIIQ